MRPKQRSEFTKGLISRWDVIDDTRRCSKLISEHRTDSNVEKNNRGKEKYVEINAFKVYSRNKLRRDSNMGAKMERNGVLLGDDSEDMDSDIEGDKILFRKPDSTSNSSLSDSEEGF